MVNNNQSNTTQIIARVLLSAIFLYSFISKITGWEGTIQFMESKGMPFAPLLLVGAVITELAGALSLCFGYRMKQGALLLGLYLIPTTLIFHNFWAVEGQQVQIQLLQFFKNISIMGGLLLLTTISEDNQDTQ